MILTIKNRIPILCWLIMVVPLFIQAQPVGEDGPTKYYYPNGQVSSEGTLVNGKPEGWWKTYYETGVLRSQGNRVRFLLDSTWSFYAADGSLLQTIDYRADKKNGMMRKFGPDGTVLSEEPYVNDLREGEALEFDPNGHVQKRVSFRGGKEEGRAYEYAEDGRIISVLNYSAGVLKSRTDINRKDALGEKQGPWKEFHANGKVKWEGTFVDDKLQGIVKEYDVNGGLLDLQKFDLGVELKGAEETKLLNIKNTYHPNGKIESIGTFTKEGAKQGLFRRFGTDGKPTFAAIYSDDRLLSEGSVSEVGALEGHWIEYYNSGEKRAEGEYRSGKREGEWVYYHRSGAVEQRGNYANGLAQGAWKWYYENGALHREEDYRKGREDGMSVEYDGQGTIITQGEYIDGLKEGKWIYHVGDHTEEGEYRSGLRNGEWVHVYDNGRKSFVGRFVEGEPEGKHRWYWPNGQVKMEGQIGRAHV